ncbi:MAG: MarR family winged helix-turn-helix transcriptional regulator [Rhizobiaceae bacterium]
MLTNGDDGQFRQMIYDFFALSSKLEVIRERFGARIGINGRQYSILIAVSHLQGNDGVGVNAVADHLHLSGAFVTTEVSRLIELGLVEKEVNPRDRRRVLLSVTPEGLARLNALVAYQAPVNDILFQCLDRNDFLALSRILSELLECADNAQALQVYLDSEDAAARGRARRR